MSHHQDHQHRFTDTTAPEPSVSAESGIRRGERLIDFSNDFRWPEIKRVGESIDRQKRRNLSPGFKFREKGTTDIGHRRKFFLRESFRKAEVPNGQSERFGNLLFHRREI